MLCAIIRPACVYCEVVYGGDQKIQNIGRQNAGHPERHCNPGLMYHHITACLLFGILNMTESERVIVVAKEAKFKHTY